MAIEYATPPAGDGGGSTDSGSGGSGSSVDYDIGQGAMNGNDAFSLPDDFEQNIDDIEIEPVPASGATPQPGAEPAAGTPQPGQQPAAAPAQPVAPAQQPPTTPAQPAQPAGDTANQPSGAGRVFTPSELAQQLGRNRDTMIEALASQKFALSTAEIQALEVDAVGVLPKIMARVYFEATVNNLQQMANMVPRMVEHVANERIAESKAEADFHTEWPNIDMNNADHARAVMMLSASFRQMYPGATIEQAIQYVGTAATNFLGLSAPVRGGNGSGRPAAAAPRRTAPPFAPANGGRAQPPAGTPTVPPNPFAGLGTQFDE